MNDIERLEQRCEDLEKECRTLREVLASILMGGCPLSHEPIRHTTQPKPCAWCGAGIPPDAEYVAELKKLGREWMKPT